MSINKTFDEVAYWLSSTLSDGHGDLTLSIAHQALLQLSQLIWTMCSLQHTHTQEHKQDHVFLFVTAQVQALRLLLTFFENHMQLLTIYPLVNLLFMSCKCRLICHCVTASAFIQVQTVAQLIMNTAVMVRFPGNVYSRFCVICFSLKYLPNLDDTQFWHSATRFHHK